jgi:hypothetical protein
MHRPSIIPILVFLSLLSPPALAWNALPLSVESPTTLPAGDVQFEIGCGFLGHKNFAFSPFSRHFHRDVLSWPTFGARIGLGSHVELRMMYEVLFVEEDELRIKERWKSGDLAFFTKIHAMSERRWRPSFGITLGAKLPNAGNSYRVGTDETDLAFLLLAEKRMAPVGLNAHIGLLILGDPYSLARQDDLLAYGLAGTAPLWSDIRVRAEVTGQAMGTSHNAAASAILSLLLDQEHLVWNLSGRVGLLPNSEAWGISGGVRFTMTFEALQQFFTGENE